MPAASAKAYGKEDTKISVSEGQTFTIALEENITTGYAWTYTISDESIVKMEKDEHVQEQSEPQRVGAAGTRVVTFKALKKGAVTITFAYERSWERNPDDEKIVYDVEVK